MKGNRVKSNLVRVLFMKLYIHNMYVRAILFCGRNWVVSSIKETRAKYADNIVSRAFFKMYFLSAFLKGRL